MVFALFFVIFWPLRTFKNNKKTLKRCKNNGFSQFLLDFWDFSGFGKTFSLLGEVPSAPIPDPETIARPPPRAIGQRSAHRWPSGRDPLAFSSG